MLSFSKALEELKDGNMVLRSGWNGKGMYLFIIEGSVIENSIANYYKECNRLPVQNAIYMKTADNKLVPWLASQTDILAEDWDILM